MSKDREKLSSRLGFLLLSAGCAIGLGNVWRFPYIVGKYGGAAFVLLYLLFLLLFGLPIMVMEFSVGRASRKSVAVAFHLLEPKGSKWHWFRFVAIGGNYLLLMFYTTVAGWMLAYIFYTAKGDLQELNPTEIGNFFGNLLANPFAMIFWMAIALFSGFIICIVGLKNGVEKASKIMMSGLFFIMIALVIRALTLPNAQSGLSFYLKPDFHAMAKHGLGSAIYAAMGQAFFTLSIGIGSMTIFGSYIDKKKSLAEESLFIMGMDTTIALMAGLIIFPTCLSFNINPGKGPELIFITLPNIFNNMAGGQIWGTLFFIFMGCAALTTLIAVFENIVAFAMDSLGWSRAKSSLINFAILFVFSLPCSLGFNLLSKIQPLGVGSTILDLEDFIVSDNLLPGGSLIFLLFCCSKRGWGWDHFVKEANTGDGIKFPTNNFFRFYVKYIIPLIVLAIFVAGYLNRFTKVFQ